MALTLCDSVNFLIFQNGLLLVRLDLLIHVFNQIRKNFFRQSFLQNSHKFFHIVIFVFHQFVQKPHFEVFFQARLLRWHHISEALPFFYVHLILFCMFQLVLDDSNFLIRILQVDLKILSFTAPFSSDLLFIGFVHLIWLCKNASITEEILRLIISLYLVVLFRWRDIRLLSGFMHLNVLCPVVRNLILIMLTISLNLENLIAIPLISGHWIDRKYNWRLVTNIFKVGHWYISILLWTPYVSLHPRLTLFLNMLDFLMQIQSRITHVSFTTVLASIFFN